VVFIDEALEKFSEDAYVCIEVAQWYRQQGLHIKALEVAHRANDLLDLTSEDNPRFLAELAAAYGALNQAEQAEAYFQEAITSAVRSADSFHIAGTYQEAISWSVAKSRPGLTLRWVNSFDRNHGLPLRTDKDSGVIYEQGGLAALITKQFSLAAELYEALVIQQAHWLAETQQGSSKFSLARQARANLPWATAELLRGKADEGRARLNQAEALDPDNDLLPAVQALLLVKQGEVREAVEHLFSNQVEPWY
jgi:tetratricopeptide (TPR) repeat protein